jgi:subtilase family serine protease
MRLMKAFPLTVFSLSSVLSLLSAALLSSTALLAQNSAVPPRITTDVNELSLATLKGNVPGLARAEFDQGEAAPSTQLTHVRLVLARSTEQQAALDAYLAQLQDKSSPNYHKWLTPEQFGQLYGPADSDIAALVAWLESHGLQVETVSKGRTNIAFNGTVRQVEEAFHTSIHSFLVNGGQAGEQQFFSNTTDPQIPLALAPVVKGVAHLNTIRPRPYFVRGSAGQFNPETKRLEPANGPSPMLTVGGDFLYLVPGDAATIYDTPNSFNANFSSGTSYTGAGVNIGLGGDATISASIVGAYRSMFLGSSTSVNLNYCTTSASCSTTPSGIGYDASDADEAYIDTELSGGMAPGATIYYYASPDLYTGIEAAIDANVVDIFSLSFGDCEQDMGGSGAGTNGWFNSLWEQAAGQGIAVMVSAGDSGSAGCDYPSTNSGKNVPDASYGLAVSGYASTPYNIAVGGTDLAGLSTSFSTYASTSQGSSSTFYRTALKYIPESTWNDSTISNIAINANIPSTNSCAGGANIVAGSGGASTIYSRPIWQTGAGAFDSGNMRDLPDVSFMSGNGCEPATWLVCTNDRYNNTQYKTNCETQSNGNFYFVGYGGTSTASPVFAGILALVEQKTGSKLGMPAQELYSLFNGSHSNSIFHDQNKVGNNSVPCTSSSANCVKNVAGYYFESGYNTNPTGGYDMATGMGSVDATQLVTYWSSGTGSAAATVSFLSLSPNPVTTVQSLTVTVSVSGASGTPTGTVTLTGGSYNSSQTIGSGTCTAASCAFSIPAGNLPIGSDTLTVTYGGNSTYAVATNSTTATVNGLNAAVTITSPASGANINSNTQLTVSGTVACTGACAGSTTPTGTVTLTSVALTQSLTGTLSGSGGYSITIPYNSLSGGTDSLTVTYNGSSVYNSGANNSVSVNVTYVAVATPTVTITPASGSIDSSQTYGVTVTVTGSSSLESAPTGTVTLTSGSYTSGVVTLGTAGCTSGSCVSITIPAGSLSNGSDTLTATYSGDADYSSGIPGTASVTVTKSGFALNATSPSASIAPGAPATSTLTVSSSTHYTGTVTLTCALTSGPSNASGDTPSCSNGSNTLSLISGVVTGTASATVTVYTTAASAALAYPKLPGRGNGRGLFGAGGGAVLAFLVFLGIPARRRSWRSMLGLLVLMTALGSLAACGGGGGGGGGGGNPGTMAGTYTFTVTGTGNPTVTPPPTATFTVTVN